MSVDALHAWLQQWPKLELHRHLEGTVRFETAWTWSRHHPELSELARDQLRTAIEFDGNYNFAEFLSKFKTLRKLYTSREAIEQVAYEAVEDAANDNVRYLELRFSPEHFAEHNSFTMDEVAGWVIASANAAADDRDIIVRFLLTIGREYTLEHATEILAIGLRRRDVGVVGFDLAGDEVRHPHPPFEGLYARARQEGLGITIHAGEAGGADRINDAVTRFSAHRIGHGIRSLADPELMTLLRERDIALEVCPTSNVQTGVVESHAEHPLADLVTSGVPLVLCTDDPRISGITLTDEWVNAVTEIGLAVDTLADLVRNGIEYAFLPRDEKDHLRDRISEELGAVETNTPAGVREYTS